MVQPDIQPGDWVSFLKKHDPTTNIEENKNITTLPLLRMLQCKNKKKQRTTGILISNCLLRVASCRLCILNTEALCVHVQRTTHNLQLFIADRFPKKPLYLYWRVWSKNQKSIKMPLKHKCHWSPKACRWHDTKPHKSLYYSKINLVGFGGFELFWQSASY